MYGQMNNIKTHIARLAFQVDRRILSLEEETYLRLDLLAHERAFAIAPAQRISMPKIQLPQANLAWFKEYAFMAILLFSLMFYLSNMPSYGKISMANISAAQDSRIDNMEIVTGRFIANDAWTGEKVGNFTVAIPTLEAKDQLVLRPDDGILGVTPVPSSIEDRISIPSLEINAPLIAPELGLEALKSEDWNELEEEIRSSLLQGVVHYPGTANPGKKGNFFVTGHSSNVFWETSVWNTIFALLPQIEIGNEIVVTKDQREYTYIVTEIKEVSPKDVAVLSQGDEHEMTIMTCTPVGTTLNRLVVTAILQ
jgi:LPXTG-site transpeptidase (sortase) family protein